MTETIAGRRRLGRGLEALLGPTREEAEREGSLVELAIADIRPNPYQPRRDVDSAALEELQASIRKAGLLQPVVVRPVPGANGGFELIAGERRLRACQALGWEKIPAVKREVDDRTALTLALVENLQRDDLSPVDEARGYERLLAEFSLTQQDVADAVGRDRSTVANALRLLKLPPAVLALLHEGGLSVGHARALLALEDARVATSLAKEAVDLGLSVREVEDRVRGGRAPVRRPRLKKGMGQAPEVRRIEDALRRRLGTDVRVTLRAKGKGRSRAAPGADSRRAVRRMKQRKDRRVTIVVHTDGDLASRQYRVPLWALEAGKWSALVVGLLIVLFFAFAGPIGRAAARVPGLERQVARLEEENSRVQQLAAALNRAEANYQELRTMLGVRAPREKGATAPTGDLVRAVAVRARPPSAPLRYEPGPAEPTHWPLDVAGFVTRGQVRPGDVAESHPGIDIAVPAGTPVRAAGGGSVEAAGTDPAYGLFVLMRHSSGYETMYGHASRLLVREGDSVQAGQVIALSGNSGRSTAPHLHFEIRREGKSLDPLTVVKQEN